MGGLNILGSTAENKNETLTQNASGGADNGAQQITSSAGSTVNVLDGGAISGAFDLLTTNFATSSKSNRDISLASIKGIKEATNKANTSDLAGFLPWLIGGGVVVAAVMVFKP